MNSQTPGMPDANSRTVSDPAAMHRLTPEMMKLAGDVLLSVLERQSQDPWQLGETASPDELSARAGQTVTAPGLGSEGALRL